MITRRYLLTVSAAGVAFSAAGLAQRAVAQAPAESVHTSDGLHAGAAGRHAQGSWLPAQMEAAIAETIVVETRPGAAGRIAVEAVKTADADGTVMLFAPLGFMTLFPHAYKTLRYAPRDFTPVSTVASTPTLLTVGPKIPGDARTLVDFVSWRRANSRHATYGTAGVGTTLHFSGAMLGRTAGFEFLHVPYQGNGSIQDLLKGEIASTVMPIGSSSASSDPEIYARWRPPDHAAACFFPLCQRWRKPDIRRLRISHGMGFSFRRRRQRISSKSSMLPSKPPYAPTR